MVQAISFSEALERTAKIKRHLLLGNGFSIAIFPDRFHYGSLLEQADFSDIPQAKEVFRILGTTDFEVVIQALRQSALLLPIYSQNENCYSVMANHAELLKELLVQAIAGRHPERPSDIEEEQYRACRKFLAHFSGESRNLKPDGGADLRACLYTLNYDLLLYWTLLHDRIITSSDDDPFSSQVEPTEILQHDDGFRAPDDLGAEYVTWDGEETHSQDIHYLHGALHLYDYGYELQKKCWERSGGLPLIDQVRDALTAGKFPLFVSEGNSNGKFERIRHSGYLHKGLRSFRANCDQQKHSLFIFGHSLAENDAHILKQIEKGRIGQIYISLYGDINSPNNKEIIQRAFLIKAKRSVRYPLEVEFFDAASAHVWDSN